jgi:hypothetical protein
MEIPFVVSIRNSVFQEENVNGLRVLTLRLICNKIMITHLTHGVGFTF